MDVAHGTTVDTVAYVKSELNGMKMVLLDVTSLDEVTKPVKFDGNYATAGHDQKIVLVIDVKDAGDENETFQVDRKPYIELAAAA